MNFSVIGGSIVKDGCCRMSLAMIVDKGSGSFPRQSFPIVII